MWAASAAAHTTHGCSVRIRDSRTGRGKRTEGHSAHGLRPPGGAGSVSGCHINARTHDTSPDDPTPHVDVHSLRARQQFRSLRRGRSWRDNRLAPAASRSPARATYRADAHDVKVVAGTSACALHDATVAQDRSRWESGPFGPIKIFDRFFDRLTGCFLEASGPKVVCPTRLQGTKLRGPRWSRWSRGTKKFIRWC